jgi:hypothetical protein
MAVRSWNSRRRIECAHVSRSGRGRGCRSARPVGMIASVQTEGTEVCTRFGMLRHSTPPSVRWNRCEQRITLGDSMQWQYHIVAVDTLGGLGASRSGYDAAVVQEHLNALGRDGWELASSFPTAAMDGWTRSISLIFKRPISPDFPPAIGAPPGREIPR